MNTTRETLAKEFEAPTAVITSLRHQPFAPFPAKNLSVSRKAGTPIFAALVVIMSQWQPVMQRATLSALINMQMTLIDMQITYLIFSRP